MFGAFVPLLEHLILLLGSYLNVLVLLTKYRELKNLYSGGSVSDRQEKQTDERGKSEHSQTDCSAK